MMRAIVLQKPTKAPFIPCYNSATAMYYAARSGHSEDHFETDADRPLNPAVAPYYVIEIEVN